MRAAPQGLRCSYGYDRDEPDVTPKTTDRFVIDGPAGKLEVALNAPTGAPRGIALVAHPHPQQGGTLDNKVVQTLAKTFFALGYASVRFNFRGVGQSEGTFDDGVGVVEVLMTAYRSAEEERTLTLPVPDLRSFRPAVARGTWRP